MYKAILFDIDGVLIDPPHYYSKTLELEGYEDACNILNNYYSSNNDKQCCVGSLKIEDCIKPYLEKLSKSLSVKDYLRQQYDFEKDYLNHDLIENIKSIKSKNIKCFLATDQNTHRAKFLLNELGFIDHFDGYFISCYLGFRKVQQGFWDKTISKIKEQIQNIKLNEIAFLDDRTPNIELANKNGISTYLIKSKNDIRNFTKRI